MDAFIAQVRPILEALYFISGVLLLISLWFAYNQLSIIKRQAQLSAERAAKERAIEAASLYVSRVVPASNIEYDALKSAGVSMVFTSNPDFVFRPFPRDHWFYDDRYLEVMALTISTCNELEAIAAYYVTGVADPDVGFRIIGRSFCSTVEMRYEMINFMRNGHVCPNYQSIVELYRIWKASINSIETDEKIKNMKLEIDRLALRASNAIS